MKYRILLSTLFVIFMMKQSVFAETEPNNNRNKANAISANDNATGAIGYAGDEDWYKVILAKDGKLNITLSSANQFNIGVFLYDNNGTALLNVLYTNSSAVLSTDGIAAGTYFIKIIAFYSDQVGNYGIATAFTTPVQTNDEEPNNIKVQALTLLPADSLTGHVGYYYQKKRDSSDWYKVVLAQDGKLQLSITAANAQTTWCTLYDNNGTTVLLNAKSTEYPVVSIDGLAAGTYYVKVYMFYPEGFTPYKLVSKFTAATPANDAEPNNTKAQALPLAATGSVTGHVGYYYQNKRDLSDWYKIVLVQDGNLKLSIAAANGQTAWCTLYDKNGTTVLNNAKSTEYPTINTDGLAAGTYYVRVYMFYPEGFTTYTVTSTLTTYANDNDTEPDNAPYQAKTIDANGIKTGHIGFYQNGGSRDTTDWWKINYTGSGNLTLNTTMNAWISDGLKRNYNFEVYKDTAASPIYQQNIAGGNSGNINLTGLAHGYYYLKVYMFYNDQFGAYSISNAFKQKAKAKVTLVDADTSATCDSTNSITIKCTGSQAPYSVQLYRYNLLYGSVTTISNNKNFVFNNLPKGNYYVKVYGDGATGNAFGKTTETALMPEPANPKTTGIKNTQAKLNWKALSCVKYFSVQYRKASATSWTTVNTNGSTKFLLIKNLTASTKYYWRVAAADSSNGITILSAYTDSVTFTTAASFGIAEENTETEAVAKTLLSAGPALLVYPNPVKSSFRIQFNTKANVQLFATLKDMNGNIVWSKNNVDASTLSALTVDVVKLVNGVYVLQVSDAEGNTAVRKVLVSK